MIIISIFLYLVMLGANKCKTAEERKIEDEEECRILNEEWRKKHDK